MDLVYKSRRRRRRRTFSGRIKMVDHHSSSSLIKKVEVNRVNQSIDLDLSDLEDQMDDVNHSNTIVDAPVVTNDDVIGVNNLNTESETSDYYQRQAKAAESWSCIRSSILKCIIQMEAIPVTKFNCAQCNKEEAIACCHDCGGFVALYCIECIKALHSRVNITHSLLVWKEEEFRFVPLHHTPVLQPLHTCCATETYFKEFTCADVTGIKKVIVELCSCFDEIEALTLLRLFPATPKHPHLVFTFNLLNLFECLFLECQVSVQDFVTALQLNYQNSKNEIDVLLYPVMIDSFEQYRNIKHDLRTLKSILPLRVNSGTRCPACFQNDKPTISIDANFGLCRKVSAGISVANPLHLATGIFCDQSLVDDFVHKYTKDTKQDANNNECNKFLATDALRSKNRFHALDETGVVGAVCKHEFPHSFLSLRHGERFSYIVYVMEEIKKLGTVSVNLLYDVACTLEKHLKKQRRDDLLTFFKLAVPVFHSYGHKIDCQLKYSPRNISGYGMADGEGCERLWSYLRRFSRITKESRPSRRFDILTDAVLYYGRVSCDRLESLLPQRYLRFDKLRKTSKTELENLMKYSPIHFTFEDITKWYKSQCVAEEESSNCDVTVNWEEIYFNLLQSYYSLSSQLTTGCITTETTRTLSNHIVRLDKELQEIEAKHGVKERVQPNSTSYNELNYSATLKQAEMLKKKIGVLARERWFMLTLKAKFADGQYLASRLSASVSKATTKLKSLLHQYNSLNIDSLSWGDVSDLSSHVWYEGTLRSEDIDVPLAVKLKALEHYHIMCRCDEELQMLAEDMKNVINFYLQDHLILNEEIVKLCQMENTDSYIRGCMASLHQERFEVERNLISMQKKFAKIIPITLPTSLFTYVPSSLVTEVNKPSQNDMSSQYITPLQSPHHNPSHNHFSPEQTYFPFGESSSSTNTCTSTVSGHSLQLRTDERPLNISLEPLQMLNIDTDDLNSQRNDNDDFDLLNWRLKSQSDDESSIDEDEVEYHFNWRKRRFEREEYLQELTAIAGDQIKEQLLDEYKDLLVHMKNASSVAEDFSSYTRGSFLKVNSKLLKQAVDTAGIELAGPHFIQKK